MYLNILQVICRILAFFFHFGTVTVSLGIEEEPLIITSAHHYVLKNSTASGEWEACGPTAKAAGMTGHHGDNEARGTPNDASCLYFGDSKQDSGTFEDFL